MLGLFESQWTSHTRRVEVSLLCFVLSFNGHFPIIDLRVWLVQACITIDILLVVVVSPKEAKWKNPEKSTVILMVKFDYNPTLWIHP